ncbi:MAG: hypothetical protein ACI94Y_000877 [Maribacter sp.]|jgi:hypothetical protein
MNNIKYKILSLMLLITAIMIYNPVSAQELVIDGGFESGGFGSWIAVDAGAAGSCGGTDGNWVVGTTGSGTETQCNVLTAPPTGTFGVFHMFDASVATVIRLHQNIVVPAGVTSATLDFNYNYDVQIFGGSTRGIEINIYDAAGTTLLNNLYSETVGTASTGGWANINQDVTAGLVAHSGTTVSIDISLVITVGWDGPAAIGFDDMSLVVVAAPPVPAVIANDDADGDGIPDITDPCDCTDPLNPDPAVVLGPGGGEVFHELVTVTSGAGETWTMDATTTGALDATGVALALPAAMTEISPGVYTLGFYHEIAVGYAGDFGNGTATLAIANTCTATCSSVPTLGEWGLIILTLGLLNMGILFVVRRRKSLQLA